MYHPRGFFITCDDALCYDCFVKAYDEDNPWPGFEGWDEPLAIFNSEESDTPTHCIECGDLIEHDLTDAGYSYVAEAIGQCFQEGKQNPVVSQWINHYGEWMDDVTLPQADAVNMQDAIALFFLLPKDVKWLLSNELRKHAILAGWDYDKETT